MFIECNDNKKDMNYTIEQTEKEILIRLPRETTPGTIQGVLNYFRYLELGLKNNIEQEEIDEMAKEAKSGWWEANKQRFEGLEGFENFGK
jgi:hypothetical protein